ncbi:MAG: hypothetical protein ACD_59C00111G0003 [uncultured bacterium]|nr:MAG: hypothetical protein ACD_59C00111G0003 [uncultured bacterium]
MHEYFSRIKAVNQKQFVDADLNIHYSAAFRNPYYKGAPVGMNNIYRIYFNAFFKSLGVYFEPAVFNINRKKAFKSFI